MSEFKIEDKDLVGLKGKVAVITGGSSGIGLATVTLLLSLGATVISGDINPPPTTAPSSSSSSFLYHPTNVTSWPSLCSLFSTAKEKYGRIDAVFANAGVAPRANWLAVETAENGELKEPDHSVLDIMLRGAINTGALGCHYLGMNGAEGGSLCIMGSSTGLHPVRGVDYSTAKHGVLGYGRGIAHSATLQNLPIKINILAPSWTASQILPDIGGLITAVNYRSQSTEVVARAAAYLMVQGEGGRHGDVVFVQEGRYMEIQKGILAEAYDRVRGDEPSDDEILGRLYALIEESTKAEAAKAAA